MLAETLSPNPLIVEKLKTFYLSITNMPLDNIDTLYDKDVIFIDPVHEIRGITEVHRYMTELCKELSTGRFEYLDEVISDNKAYLKWNMHFSHPKLGSKKITVRGVTQLHFNERIYYHEDVYDMGEMLYQHVPVVGSIISWLKHRLAA
jgi:esterase/lipase superfamily enzyme